MNDPVSDRLSERLSGLPPERRALFLKLRAGRPAGVPRDHVPVPLRPGPGPARLVLLHPSGGALFCYTPLIRALRPDIDVTGWSADPADRADRGVPDAERMAVVAGRLLTALARIADPADCLLAGWSHGGVLAFEMARQHAEAGGRPPHAILIDCCYWGNRPPEDEATLRRRFVYDLIRLDGGDDAIAESAAAAAPDLDAAGLRAALGSAGVSLMFTDSELADRYQTFRACCLALQSYTCPATRYGGQVTLMATQHADILRQRWAAVVTGPMRTVRLPGDHFTLFRPPALALVRSQIEAAAGPRPPEEDGDGPRPD